MADTELIRGEMVEENLVRDIFGTQSYQILSTETYGGDKTFPKGALMAKNGSGYLIEYDPSGSGAETVAVCILMNTVTMDGTNNMDATGIIAGAVYFEDLPNYNVSAESDNLYHQILDLNKD